MPTPPQSVLKTRARRVFGEFVVEEPIPENSCDFSASLCYSPSPDVSVQSGSTAATKKKSIEKEPPKMIGFPCRNSSDSNASSTAKENSINQIDDSAVALPKKAPDLKIVTKTDKVRTKRRDLVKETQRNINNASASVNETLNAARVARKINFELKSDKAAKIRNMWKEDTQEAIEFQKESEKNRHGILHLQRKLASDIQQARARVESKEKDARLDALTEEFQFNSDVYRAHKQALKEERDRRRRESTQARAKLRKNHREGEEILRMKRTEEELTILEERNEGYVASRQFKQEVAAQRRKSFVFRNGDAKRIRELFHSMKADELQREHESIELKLDAARDVDAYKKQCEEERRKSLALRAKEAFNQRERLCDVEGERAAKEHASYELKWAGERDAEAYRKENEKQRRESLAQRNAHAKNQRDVMEEQRLHALANQQASIALKLEGERDAEAYRRKLNEERRLSLAQRNAHAKNQRELMSEMEMQAQIDEHESYELKWAAEKDAEAYQKQMEKERRESLKFRNNESFKHAQVMDELRSIAQEKESESYMLKWAGEQDAKEYLAKCEEERRQSLKLRNNEAKRHRQLEDEIRLQELEKVHQDELLRAAGHKDMEAYKRECAERDRNSLIFRRKEANLQRLEAKRQEQEDYENNQRTRMLDDDAHRDVTAYLKECGERRRLSLAFRAKEKRRHRKWEQEQADRDLEKKMQECRLRSKDRRQQEMARREERRRIALEAIRHAGCSFNVNAFSQLRVDY